jgi:asparagine synthase (glutamine-hydrolysing)
VHKLESGHSLEISGKGITIQQDWDMAYPEEKLTSEKEIEEKIYSLTRQAVEMQLNYRSGIDNVGCFLSGGTDSSTVAGLINELYPGQAKTFSIGFDESGFDEMYYARIAAKAFSTRHIEYYVTPKDIFEQLPRIVANYDEPFANSSVIPTYYCSKVAKENGIDVLLGGDGGDEVFGGNKRYHDNFADFQKYPQWLVNSLWPVLHTIPGFMRVSVVKKAYNHVRRASAPLHERIHSYSLLQYFAQDDVFDADFLAAEDYIQPAEISQKYIDRVDTDNPLDRYLYNDLKLTLMDNDLRKVTQMTGLANVNVRYPFLDFRIIEFSGLIPPELKVNNGQLRYVFKKAFGKLLPAEIIGKSKHGFGLPVVPWMLRPGQLNDMLRDIVFSQSTYNRGIFKRSFVEKLYKESLSDKTTFYGTYLYFILFLEMWLRKHVDRKNA